MTISEVFDWIYKAEVPMKQLGYRFSVTVNLGTIEGGRICNGIRSFEEVKEIMVQSYKENAEAYIKKLEAKEFNFSPKFCGDIGYCTRWEFFDEELSENGEHIQVWVDIG